MIKQRKNIHNWLIQYLNANDYKINVKNGTFQPLSDTLKYTLKMMKI